MAVGEVTVPARRKLDHGGPPLMENGDHLDRKTFHRLYEQMPPGTRAELINGIVYMPSPVGGWHGRPHAVLMGWLFAFETDTPGVESLDNATDILGEQSEPQPDAMLIIQGGQTSTSADGYIVGPPEFVAEVSASSASYDINQKKAMYEKEGVREYLVLLVTESRAIWFHNEDGHLVEIVQDADGIHRSRMMPGLHLDSDALFRGDSRRLRDVLNQGLQSPEHAAFVESLKPKT